MIKSCVWLTLSEKNKHDIEVKGYASKFDVILFVLLTAHKKNPHQSLFMYIYNSYWYMLGVGLFFP